MIPDLAQLGYVDWHHGVIIDELTVPQLDPHGSWDPTLRLLREGNLIACWPMREAVGTTMHDVSGSVRHGAYSGAPTLNEAGVESGEASVYYPGTVKYGALYSDSLRDAFNPTEFTVSIWAYLDGTWDTTYRPLITLGADVNNYFSMHKQSIANRFDITYKAGGTSKYVADTTFSPSGWFNIAATVSVTNDTLITYLNGFENGTRITSGLGTWAGNLATVYCRIGLCSAFGTNSWLGWTAYACVWDCVLTDDEIAEQARLVFPGTPTLSAYGTHVLTVAPSNLLGYWTQGESSGLRMYDSSGNSRHGSYSGVTVAASSAGDGMTTADYPGGDAFSNPFSLDLASVFDADEGSLLLFVNRDGGWTDATAASLVTFGVDSNNLIFIAKAALASRVDVFRKAGGTLQYITDAAFSPVEGSGWVCIGMSWSAAADSMRMYVDGRRYQWLQETLAAWTGTITRSICVIGASNQAGLQPFDGRIAHIQLYDTPLTDAQFADLANIKLLTQTNVIYQGTSITVGGNATTYADSQLGLVDDWLRSSYQSRFFVSANVGRGGTGSWNALARMNYYTLSIVPDYINIDFHNDHAAVPAGNDADFWDLAEEAWIRRVWTEAPDCNISITIWPIVESDGSIAVDGTYQTKVKALAANYGIPVIDVHTAIKNLLAAGHSITEYYNYPTDRTHPLDAGHLVGAQLLWTQMSDIITGARQFGSGSTLPARINDSSAYEHGTELYEPGTLYDSKTGTWIENYQGLTSSTAGSTITYSFTGCSIGVEKYGSSMVAQVCDYQIDSDAFVEAATVSDNGLYVAAYGAHTITFRVRSGQTLNIYHFLAV